MKKLERLFLGILPVVDLVGIVASFLLAYLFRDYLNQVYLMPFGRFLQIALPLSILWPFVFIWVGLYSVNLRRNSLEEFLKIVLGCSAALTLSTTIIYSLREFAFSRLVLIITWLVSVALIWLLRFILGTIQNQLYRKGLGHRRILILGKGKNIELIRKGIEAENDPSQEIIEVTSSYHRALEKIKKNQVDEIILASSNITDPKIADMIARCESQGVIFKLAPDLFQTHNVRTATYDLAGIPLIRVKSSNLEGWAIIIKRIFDITAATLALLITAPIMIITAVAIRIDSPGTIFYKDERVGKGGRPFKLIKFRSMRMLVKNGQMVHAKEDEEIEKIKEQQVNYKLENDPRVTRVGHFIRKTSIDELPQFWNILKGEMSLVGPRAYRRDELELQQQRYPGTKDLVRRLLTVKPGLTGLWQVSGRSEIAFSERVAMDAYYATNATLIEDLKLVLRTIPVVIQGSGAQ